VCGVLRELSNYLGYDTSYRCLHSDDGDNADPYGTESWHRLRLAMYLNSGGRAAVTSKIIDGVRPFSEICTANSSQTWSRRSLIHVKAGTGRVCCAIELSAPRHRIHVVLGRVHDLIDFAREALQRGIASTSYRVPVSHHS
jgi:hypothetical protein